MALAFLLTDFKGCRPGLGKVRSRTGPYHLQATPLPPTILCQTSTPSPWLWPWGKLSRCLTSPPRGSGVEGLNPTVTGTPLQDVGSEYWEAVYPEGEPTRDPQSRLWRTGGGEAATSSSLSQGQSSEARPPVCGTRVIY